MSSEVREERTNWRDERISKRHRRWGWDCPAIDLDFILLEYDQGRAVALVEYKHELADIQYPAHPSYRALIDLGNRADIPVIAVRYADDFSWWKITPLNKRAKDFVPEQKQMDEKQYVALLYKIRGSELSIDIFEEEVYAI